VLALPGPAAADAVTRWQPFIAEASQRFGIPETWLVRVMRAESGGMTEMDGRPIRSTKGAMGLMQLMPGTWSDMRARLGLGADPYDPRDNILAGTCYLRLMYDRFGYPGLFAAYNAGPGRYAEWLAGRAALRDETIAYVAKVAPAGRVAQQAAIEAPTPPLFAVRRELADVAAQDAADRPRSLLFALRKDPQ
jgi:soluble lytic murein transglycosylase-like protein